MNFLKKSVLGIAKKFKFLPPELYARIYFEYYYERKLDLDNPVEFNEKIQWLKVYYHPPILNKLVDKYEVREYVKEKIGDQYLNEILALYSSVAEVDFDQLPSQFVLKTTHGYNNNIIVRDKATLNLRKSKLRLYKWMSRNQYYQGGQEWAYKDITPRIIAEKYLPEIDNNGVSDIKFYCFNGTPEFIEVTIQVESVAHRSYFDPHWNTLEMERMQQPNYGKKLQKPKNLEKMVELAGKLANKFPFVRVDLYNIDGKILFGELTFYPADARYPFYPEKYNKIYGDKIKLPRIPEGKKEIKEI
jgi:hypothetical protein